MGYAARARVAMHAEMRAITRLRVQMQQVAPFIKTDKDVSKLLALMREDQRFIASLLLKPYLKP